MPAAKKRKRPGKKASQVLSPAERIGAKAVIELHTNPPTAAHDPGLDSGLWERARTQWMLGDWDSLASLELAQLEHLPHRAELAALSACAQLQKGNKQAARKSLAAASRWNCAPAFMVRALVAGSEASMARYHEICGRNGKSLQLLASSASALGGDGRLAATARIALAAQESMPQTNTYDRYTETQPQTVNDDEPPTLSLQEAIAAAKQQQSPWSRPSITSYAQNLEDVVLWRVLGHIENGFYVDIGAQDPILESVSKAFYERGWRGIHVEPVKVYADLLRADRPDEVVIEAAVSKGHGSTILYDLEDTGLSTIRPEIAEMHQESGRAHSQRQVHTLTLDDVLSVAGKRVIHWLKIDVEGGEAAVLEGWRTSPARPWIVCIECTIPVSRVEATRDWESVLISKGYQCAYFDGLNRFYVHSCQIRIKKDLAAPPSIFDGYVAYSPKESANRAQGIL
jgi:FkbM family methyltransferase